MASECYCGSGKKFAVCCQPLLNGVAVAQTAEALMRSRYSAYCIQNYDYIVNTYAEVKRKELAESDLAEYTKNTTWLRLAVLQNENLSNDLVEFKAWSKERNTVYLLHETSRFVVEQNQWRYLDGQLHDDCGKVSVGRNEPCVCGSGKKFKQCCLRR